MLLLVTRCFKDKHVEEGMLLWLQKFNSRVIYVDKLGFLLEVEMFCFENLKIQVQQRITNFVLCPKLLYLLQIKVESPIFNFFSVYIVFLLETGF